MPFDGNGNFVALSPPDYPAVAGEVIYAARFNAVVEDLLAGLSEVLPRDGQAAMTANLPMGGFKLTNLGAATVAGHAVEYAQWIASFVSPAFTGVPTVPTAAPATNTTQAASTAFVAQALTTAQPLDADLTALAGLATTGLLVRTGAGTVTTRELIAGPGMQIDYGDGLADNPTISVTPGIGTGDVVGPVSATADAVVTFDGVTGKLLKDSAKALPAGVLVGTTDVQTLTSKTIALGSNTVSGTLAQFNTAVTDADLVSLAGAETLTNKTLTSPTINTPSISAPTMTGAIYANGSQRSNIVAMGALDVDCSTGNYFTKTINGASTFTFSNAPASRAYAFTLELTHTSGTVTWPAAVQWPNASAPSLTTGKTHLFTFVTDDAGARWRGVSNINYTT